MTSKLSGQLKCTSVQLNTDIIVFQGSMANHFMEMDARYEDVIMTFVFFFFFFFGGWMGLFIFISSPLSNNVLKSHCFNSWDSYRRPLFTWCTR